MNKLLSLFTLLMFNLLPIQAQESDELPLGMTYPLDSLLNDWKTKNNLIYDVDCTNSAIAPQFSDSVYIA